MIVTNANGTVTFRIFLPHAARVDLLADFTQWRSGPIALAREHPGWWSATVEVPGGEHAFAYLVDGSIWLADYAAHGVRLNPHGGWTSRLVVEPAPAPSTPGRAACV